MDASTLAKIRDCQFTRRGCGVTAEEGGIVMRKNAGSLGGEMRMRVKSHCQNMSNHTKSNYMHACRSFDGWRKTTGLSNRYVRENPRASVVQWAEHLRQAGIAQSTIHTMVAGVCCGLGIPSNGIAKHGTALDKTKSIGHSARAQSAREKKSNHDIVRFQEMVGGRRAALGRLTGSDFVCDESGQPCVRFVRDKGGKTQLQRILPENVDTVKAYFDRCRQDERLFPNIDHDLDLHGIRAEHARRDYEYYAEIARTPEGREQLRHQLWSRYTDPEIGCRAYITAQANGNKARMRKLEYRFRHQMADGTYYLRGANRQAAIERGRPTRYDRLATMAVSVFALSHWRNDVTVKHYLI